MNTPANITPRSMNRLKGPQTFALWNWLQQLHQQEQLTFEDTKASLAARGTRELGFAVTVGNIQGAMETLEISLPLPPLQAEAALKLRVTRLETALRNLCDQLNVPYVEG